MTIRTCYDNEEWWQLWLMVRQKKGDFVIDGSYHRSAVDVIFCDWHDTVHDLAN